MKTTDYDDLFQRATRDHLPEHFDWRLYKAMIWQESKFDPLAESGAGALGMAQFMPDTWTEWAPPETSPVEADAAIDAGARYLGWLIDEWAWPRPEIDRHCLAIASYNAGLGHVLDAQKAAGGASLYADIIAHLPEITGQRNSAETITHVRKVVNYWITEVLT